MKAEADDRKCSTSADETVNSEAGTSSSFRAFCRRVFVFVRTPLLRRISIIMSFNWITCTMVYYGLSLNFGNFSADPFLYMFLGGLMELPSYTLIIPFVMKFGRKIPLILFLVTCGFASLIILILPGDRSSWWFLCVVMIGKFLITSAYQVIYLYCSELYPTILRTRGLGLTSMMGRLGAIISPFINDILGGYHWAIPSTIFGIISMVAGSLTCLLPETNNCDLPDTVADVEKWRFRNNRKEATVGCSSDEEEVSNLSPATTSV